MRLIHHDNDVRAVIEDALCLGELVNSGDDDFTGIIGQKLFQFFAAIRPYKVGHVGGVECA